MAYSIRLTKEDKVEEDYDIAIAIKSFNDYEDSGQKSRPIEELWRELEL